jgi:hypothetical protein
MILVLSWRLYWAYARRRLSTPEVTQDNVVSAPFLFFCPYSSKYVEEEFSEVQCSNLPHLVPLLMVSGWGRATFSPQPHP